MILSEQLLKDFLSANGFTKTGNKYLCQFHDDHKPSGGIYPKNGKWYYKCQSCGVQGDVYNLMDKWKDQCMGTAYKEANGNRSQNVTTKPQKSPRIYSLKEIENGEAVQGTESVDKYFDEEGSRILFISVRRNSGGGVKSFIQFRPTHGGYEYGGIAVLPLYRGSPAHAKRIQEAKEIVIAEGEKCVHGLHNVGIVATTKPCGAQAPEKADWSPVYNKKVYLWPDNDEKGIKYMRQVQELLRPHCELYWIDPSKYDLAEKEDAWEWVYKRCATKDKDGKIAFNRQLAQLPLDEAVPCIGSADGVVDEIEDIIQGRIVSVSLPWDELWRRSQALIPKTTTLICGEAGHGKSFFALQAMAWWHEHGVKWCVFQLEDENEYHVRRALAQRTGEWGFTNIPWIAEHPIKARALSKEHYDWMNDFGKHVWDAPDRAKTRPELGDWLEARAKDGYRIICVDPVTMVRESENKKVWNEDQDLMERANRISNQYNLSIIFVTHPKKGQSKIACLDSLAGGTAYSRFSKTVVWVERIDEIEVHVSGQGDVMIDRKIHLMKTRNGKGAGELGFRWDNQSLTFEEVGEISKDKK